VCNCQVPEYSINQHLDNSCSGLTAFSNSTPSGSTQSRGKLQTHRLAPVPEVDNAGPPQSATVFPCSSSSKATKRTLNGNFFSPIHNVKRQKLQTATLQAVAPLAEKLRPESLNEFIGQPHLTGPDSLLLSALRAGSIESLILWGPPGYV
jgi:putative ATPase